MKTTTKRYLSFLLFLFLLNDFSAAQQPGNYHYQFYNTSHGLPSPEILSLAKDSKGFLWIGTASGISMYDGYDFHNYPYSKDKEFIGYVNVIRPDIHGNLWIGSGAGLFCFINNEVIKISAPASTPQGVNDILFEDDGTTWLATENGPVRCMLSEIDLTGKKKFVLADHLLKKWHPATTNGNRAAIIKKAPDQTVYIAQDNNLFKLVNDKPELLFSTEGVDRIESVFPVSSSLVYFECISSQLCKVENGKAVVFGEENFYKPGHGDQYKGEWYVGLGGLFYFHRQTGTVSVFVDLRRDDILWPSCVLEDDDLFWVGTHDGLIKMKPSIFTSYDLRKISRFPDYYSSVQLKNGKLLLGSNRGIIIEKKDTGFAIFKDHLVPQAEIKGLYEDERGWLWIATGYQGLVLNRNNKEERFTVEHGLHDNSFSGFLKTKKGELYAFGDQGLTQIIVDEKNTISFKKFLLPPNRSQYAKFFSAVDAPDGTIWIGGEEGLAYLRNDSLSRFAFSGKQMAVNFLMKDRQGKVWIATSGEGILQCSFNGNNELQIEKEWDGSSGLNTLNYLTLLEDKENNIWAGSSRGLSFIGRNRKYKNRVLNFDESDGFIKPGYSSIGLNQDKAGKIWAVTTSGVSSLDPEAIQHYNWSPLVYITSIKHLKRNKTISDIIISKSTNKKKFRFAENSFNFDFTALDYAGQENTRFFYKMEGLDTNWISCGNLRTINFANLSPGDYSFHVKALSNKGTWSKEDAVYTFTIVPPFWQTWWFRSLIIATLLIGTGIYFRSRIHSIKREAAIRQQMTELEVKALRAQMNPHFIFNAMNSIQQFTLKSEVDNANRYISRFSTLLRKVLHSSQQKFITLEEEIEQLDLYLDIEKLRLGDSFHYAIEVMNEIETDAVKIPGMLIQPFAENALKHGLSLKEGIKKLSIQFSMEEADSLLVRITDNGVGRQKAKEVKEQQETLLPYESKGIQLVEERLRSMSNISSKTIIQFEDLYDNDKKPAGTQVILSIPLQQSL